MKKKQGNELIKRLVLSVLAVLAAAVLMTGVTAAWFTNQYKLSSIGKIHPPTYISILAPGDSVMQAIDLSYDKSEVNKNTGRVELKRPFVIRSGEKNYDLCIAHTTNISELTISLYEAVAVDSEDNVYLVGITEKGTPYYWNKNGTNLFDTDGYVNDTFFGVKRVALPTGEAHNQTFQFTDSDYKKVQKNAEPLYWVKTGCEGEKRTPDDGNFYTNYILEITWNETDKETDILYVIAQTSNNS